MSTVTTAPVTKLIVAPHPDDELLRGAGVMNWAVHQGQRIVVLGLANGDGTRLGPRDGLTKKATGERRRAEQVGAVSSLTYGRGILIQKNYSDGTVTYERALAAIKETLAKYPGAEVYAAAHPQDDGVSPDHIPTWQACRDSGATVVRYMKDPLQGTYGTRVQPVDLAACKGALAAYWWTLGARGSVPALRDAMIARNYVTIYSKPSNAHR